MFQVPLATSSVRLSSLTFWEVIMLYHNRPHIINRKLAAASQALFCRVHFSCKGIRHICELFTRPAILYEMRQLENISRKDITDEFIRNIMECFDKNLVIINSSENDFHSEPNGIFISVRILLPRSKHLTKCLEVVILDKDNNKAIFHAVQERNCFPLAPNFSYELELSNNSSFRLSIMNFEDADSTHAEWLADKLFPKLLKWSEIQLGTDGVTSLSLIPADDYCLKYNELKNKYADQLLEEWPKKTTTNPQKYIFEDLAIASYLICLWSEYSGDIKFLDCGCGNGLLVYILNQEGFTGYGIDIRRRPIWDIYPTDVRLEVGTVTPTSTFPNINWLIGNHSDELTPWIPVIALKSSLNTNFFVLPCCPYDFSGQKYIRSHTHHSQYSDYLMYVQGICRDCGFDTNIDKLRIPSTKRTCLVGVRRDLDYNSMLKTIKKIDEFIISRMPKDFTPRDKTERVRNCTQLDRELINRLVITCVKILLENENLIVKTDTKVWNKGGSISLFDLSRKLGPEDLKQLKKESGGVQTLLRNHRYLFEIKEGRVHLREPLRYSKETEKYRNKPCWFLKNHPDGCLYEADECAYSHV